MGVGAKLSIRLLSAMFDIVSTDSRTTVLTGREVKRDGSTDDKTYSNDRPIWNEINETDLVLIREHYANDYKSEIGSHDGEGRARVH